MPASAISALVWNGERGTVVLFQNELPYDPRFFTTSIAVRDLDAIREALGYPALNVYGVSYGSRVAQHYARRYPDTTRTIVLDGVVPPDLPLGPDIALESQRAVNDIFERCAADPACDERFPDLATSFEGVLAALRVAPRDVVIADPVSGEFRLMALPEGNYDVHVESTVDGWADATVTGRGRRGV